MASSSILGGTVPPHQPDGFDVDALGPSDSSDSGSDVQTDRGRSAMPDAGSEGALSVQHEGTSDAGGTGERGAADGRDVAQGADIGVDQVRSLDRDALDGAIALDDAAVADLEALTPDGEEDADDEDAEAS